MCCKDLKGFICNTSLVYLFIFEYFLVKEWFDILA